MGLFDNLFEPSGLMGAGGTAQDQLNRQIMWNRIGAAGAALLQNAGPQYGPHPLPNRNPLGNATQAFMDPHNMVGPIQQTYLQQQMDALEQNQQARANVASLLGIGPSGSQTSTTGMSPGGPGMPPAGPTVDAAARANGGRVLPENLARARALYAAGDIKGAMSALYPDTTKPTVQGGLQYDPVSKQWMEIPGYVDMQSRIRAAGKTTVNVNTGAASPIGKTAADLKYFEETYGPNHPVTQALRREIERAGVPSGDALRLQTMVESGQKTTETLYNELVKDGKVDMAKVQGLYANLPFTGGRTTRAQFEDAAAMLLRLETGAQANATEVQNMLDRYLPKPWDDSATALDKLNRFRDRFRVVAGKFAKEKPAQKPDPLGLR